jgi:hypothetical protein
MNATELQKRFGVTSGQVHSQYHYKNLNWYYAPDVSSDISIDFDWFCYGDVSIGDIRRVVSLLTLGEVVMLGWKDLSPREGDFTEPLYTYNKCWLRLIWAGAQYDYRHKSLANHALQFNEDGSTTWKEIKLT